MVIVHFLPVEYYPPTTNLLNYLADNNKTATVYTTQNRFRTPYTKKGINVKRFASPDNQPKLKRLWCYWQFTWGTLLGLIKQKPEKIVYYETYSAYPVYLYKKYINRKVEIYTHCHEYNPPEWYAKAMKLLRFYHKREISLLYPSAKWISQTHEERIRLFKEDHPYLRDNQLVVLPNYPPASWAPFKKPAGNTTAGITRCVLIGSLSIEATFIVEFCEWVKKQNGKVTFDIYSFNAHGDTKVYLKSLGVSYITYHEKGVDYDKVPAVLSQYDVGLLLYRVLTLNQKYCAPNKLFEYLVCGLDVWFSPGLIGCLPYISESAYPKVVKVDFQKMDEFDYQAATNRDNFPEMEVTYACEDVLEPLVQSLYPTNKLKNASE